MTQAISEKINPLRNPKEPFGLKAESSLNRITMTPSSINPNDTLYVEIPKLSDNVVIAPGSLKLYFDLNVVGHANRTLINNVGRNLAARIKVVFGGEVVQDTQRPDLFATYADLFLKKEDRDDRLRQGISSLNMRKLRTNAGDKSTADSEEVALAAIHNTKYVIPLQHPILDDHGVFYQKALTHPLRFEITFAPVSDIVVYADTVITPGYTITNLELEYRCITSDFLAREAASVFESGRGFFYENILLHKTFQISLPNDSVINQNINVPRRSMSGLLMLFTESYAAGARDSEKFVSPNFSQISISIDGMPNRLFSKGMVPTDFWESVNKRFNLTQSISQKEFYSDKFALWIDLRSMDDEKIHGSGLTLNSTRDGVKLEMKRTVGGTGNITCYLFVVADALMEISQSTLKSILY